MDKRIHFFSQRDVISGKAAPELLGIRGRQASEFAELGFPILPGFIIDASLASELDGRKIRDDVKTLLDRCAAITGKRYGDPDNPMLLKIVISPNLAVSSYPALHNFGLVRPVAEGFARWVGKDFAASETLFLTRGMLKIEERIRELEGKAEEQEAIAAALRSLDAALGIKGPSNELKAGKSKALPKAGSAEAYMEQFEPFFPNGFFDTAEEQLFIALDEISRMFRLGGQNDGDTALVVSPMVYGNYGKESCAGSYYSRNPVTGEKKLWGEFHHEKFNEAGSAGQPIEKIDPGHLKELQKIARTLEEKFREIRQIRFTVENGKLWLVEQRPAVQKSAQADIRLLLDLAGQKVISEAELITAVDPLRLNEILHPVIETASTQDMTEWKGGIAGSPGAAVGRAYFSTEALLEARRHALQNGGDGRFILVLKSSFAGDVKAIEVAAGVLTAEGGYAAHASVVARQYGKVSLVAPDLEIRGKKAALGALSFSEGDWLTLNVPFYGESSVYAGAARLIEPDPAGSGLFEIIALSKRFIKNFQVRANAETPRDAKLALSFGAEGIGLCRTEHMFFNAGRIMIFRDMILSRDPTERKKALDKLQVMQTGDFSRIFRIMAGKEVTVRLLDAPLHEFMPQNAAALDEYLAHVRANGRSTATRAELAAAVDALRELNPLLGHRGCRAAVSRPEIYAMQVRAIFDALYKLRAQKIDARVEIMVPVVMNAEELKLIIYGKKIEGKSYAGIVDIEEELRREKKAETVDYSIGSMIELPAAALGAGEIARYSRFFSFGTNDLTQTTLGISRDDIAAFLPDYTLFDLFTGNPFSTLDGRVKELIALAVTRGRLTRPDLVCGLCGEHGANPANVRFCMDVGINYVSCSPYSVPIALLAAAQTQLSLAEASG